MLDGAIVRGGRVSLRDAFQLALRNLRQSKLRTALTVMGVAIGIASLAGMVSLGVGLQDQFVGRFMQSGMFDSITVMPGNVQVNGPFGGGRGRGGRGGRGARPRRRHPGQTAGRCGADGAGGTRERQGGLPDGPRAGRDQVRRRRPSTRPPPASRCRPKGRGPFQTITHGEFFAHDTEPVAMLSLRWRIGWWSRIPNS